MAPIATPVAPVPEMAQAPLKSTNTATSSMTPSTLLGVSTGPRPEAVRAHGIYFDLSDGRTIIDGVGGAAVASIGMGHPDVIKAMTKQATEMGFAYHQLLATSPAEELSAWLVAKSKGVFAAAAFLNSGKSSAFSRTFTAEEAHV